MSESRTQQLKQKIGEYAVDRYVSDGMSIGLGSGTTAIWAMKHIAKKYKTEELRDIICGASGPGTRLEALALGLPVTDLNADALLKFDVTIDGADEVDGAGNVVKGGGGCLLHEKIIGYSTRTYIIIVSQDKHVSYLGKSFPVPIEIVPVALTRVQDYLHAHYALVSSTLRKDGRNIGPWITEEGNYLLDVLFAQEYDVAQLESEIVQIVGVVEVGLFTKNKPTILSIDNNGEIVAY